MLRRKSKFAPKRILSIDSANDEETSFPIADFANQPADDLLRGELFKAVHQAVGCLPVEQRKVFVMRKIEGFSTKQTAQTLDISEENVKVRLHRAKNALQVKLQHFYSL